MIHAKSIVVDSVWGMVGSSNLDRLSLERNAELNMEIHGGGLAEMAARLFRQDCAMSTRLTHDDRLQQGRARRVVVRSAWALRRWQGAHQNEVRRV